MVLVARVKGSGGDSTWLFWLWTAPLLLPTSERAAKSPDPRSKVKTQRSEVALGGHADALRRHPALTFDL